MVSEEALNPEAISPRSFYNDSLSLALLLTQLDVTGVIPDGGRGFCTEEGIYWRLQLLAVGD